MIYKRRVECGHFVRSAPKNIEGCSVICINVLYFSTDDLTTRFSCEKTFDVWSVTWQKSAKC